MPKTITSQRTINKTLNAAEIGDRFEILFVPPDNAIWYHEEEGVRMFLDARQDSLYSGAMADIIERRRGCYTIEDHNGDMYRIAHTVTEDYLWVRSQHIASLRPLPGPTKHEIDGLDHDLVLHPDGRAVVGCQTITRKGLQQIHDLLGKHLASTAAG